MSGKSYNEFMYPEFESIDAELAYLDEREKYYMASLGLSPTGADVAVDVGAAIQAGGKGQIGDVLSSVTDVALIGAAGTAKNTKKLNAIKKRKAKLKTKKQAKKTVNNPKKKVKKIIKKDIKKEIKKDPKAKMPKDEMEELVEGLSEKIYSSPKFKKVLKKNNIPTMDEVEKISNKVVENILSQGGRQGKKILDKHLRKTGKTPTFGTVSYTHLTLPTTPYV